MGMERHRGQHPISTAATDAEKYPRSETTGATRHTDSLGRQALRARSAEHRCGKDFSSHQIDRDRRLHRERELPPVSAQLPAQAQVCESAVDRKQVAQTLAFVLRHNEPNPQHCLEPIRLLAAVSCVIRPHLQHLRLTQFKVYLGNIGGHGASRTPQRAATKARQWHTTPCALNPHHASNRNFSLAIAHGPA